MAEPVAAPASQISFEGAFEAAVASQQPPAEPAEVLTEPSEPATQEPEAQPAGETGTEPAQPPEGSEEQLLSQEEYDALKDNPKALRKALNRAYTQYRMQNKPYEQLIEALKSDPKSTIELLAKHHGLEIKGTGTGQAQPTEQTVAVLKQALGPELEFLAEKLAPAFEKVVGNAIGPVQQNIRMQTALREVSEAFTEFKGRHADWQKHEPEMAKLMKVFSPTTGPDGAPLVSQAEYLDRIYALATIGRSSAETTKKVIQRLTKSAESSESPESGVGANRVAPKPAGIPTFEEAAAAAKAGIRWES